MTCLHIYEWLQVWKYFTSPDSNLLLEDQVEIRYKGRPVIPTAQLQNLVDLWLGNVTSKKVVAPPLGSSAKEFVLILSYCRRVQPS
ncbi:E3 ubiquitin protein ligase DRIP2 [Linum grandiflorum]